MRSFIVFNSKHKLLSRSQSIHFGRRWIISENQSHRIPIRCSSRMDEFVYHGIHSFSMERRINTENNLNAIGTTTPSNNHFHCHRKNHRKLTSTSNQPKDIEEKEKISYIISTSPTSLNLLSYISKSNFESIYMLPEIQSLFPNQEKKEGISNVNAIELLNRAHEVFSSFPTPPFNSVEESLESNPLVAVLLLLAHYQNEASFFDKSSATIRSIRSIRPILEDKDIDLKPSFYFALLEAQAKLEWKTGNFLEVERLAKEMDICIPEKRKELFLMDKEKDFNIHQMKTSSLTALGLSQLLRFSNDFLLEQVDDDELSDDGNIEIRSTSFLSYLKQAVFVYSTLDDTMDAMRYESYNAKLNSIIIEGLSPKNEIEPHSSCNSYSC